MMEVRSPGEPKRAIPDIDDAITAIQFEMRRKIKAVKLTEQKLELSENEKIRIGNEYALMRNINRLIDAFKRAINSDLGRVPPMAMELEESVLGAAILENGGFQKIKKFLEPRHFYRDAHQEIYQAMLDLGESPVDMHTVVVQLRKTGKLELIGGAYVIPQLTAKVSSAANIEYHARVIIEFAIKRELIMMASKVCYDAYDDTCDAFVLLDYAEQEVNRICEWRKK